MHLLSLDAAVVADRTAALRAMSPANRAKVLVALPEVAAAAWGRGALAGVDFGQRRSRQARDASVEGLAKLIADSTVIHLTIDCLDECARNLLALAKWYGGTLTLDQALAEAAPLTAAALQAAAQRLAERLLINPAKGFVSLRPGVAELVWWRGRSFRQVAALPMHLTNEVLDAMGSAMGLRMPSRKQDKVDAVHNAINDPATVRRIVDGLPPSAKALLVKLSEAPDHPLQRVGLTYWSWSFVRSIGYRDQPFVRLVASGLAGADDYEERCWVWLDVTRALSGRMFSSFIVPSEVEPRPINDGPSTVPVAVGQLEALLARAASEPLPGLKSGGIGVKVFRDLAKQTGQTERAVAVLLRLAGGLRLLEMHTEMTGRGRQMNVTTLYMPSSVHPAWSALPTAERWARLGDAWLDHIDGGDRPDTFDPIVRRMIVADLLALPRGTGIPLAEFEGWLGSRHVVLANLDMGLLLVDLRLLGLVPDDGPVGLTDIARLLLTKPAAVQAEVGESPKSFVVQPDHTVVAPATLHSDVRSRLERLAESVSRGGALVYRLEGSRIAAELARGADAASLVAFLVKHSDAPLPPAVERFIHDVERQRGGLTVAAVGTVVTAADALALAPALKVKAAQLRMVAPTVAVSPLPPAKVTTALRAKGLAPDVIGVMASAVKSRASAAPSSRPSAKAHRFEPLADCLVPDDARILALMVANKS